MLTKQVNGVTVELTPQEEAETRAEWAQAKQDDIDKTAAEEARAAQKAERLAETPASVNSVPALRDKVNEILKELRGDA